MDIEFISLGRQDFVLEFIYTCLATIKTKISHLGTHTTGLDLHDLTVHMINLKMIIISHLFYFVYNIVA